MPADYPPTTTPPETIDSGWPVITGASPSAIAPAMSTPTNTPPDTIAAAGFTPDTTAPAGIAPAGVAPDTTPPTPIASSFAETNAPPAPINASGFAPDNQSPNSITNSYPATSDPPETIGWVGQSLDDTVNTPTFNFTGVFVLNQIFGFFKAPQSCSLVRIQASVQEAPIGAAAVITLVDNNGNSLGASVTIPDGQTSGEAIVNPPIGLPTNTVVKGKITSIGSTNPGGYCTLILFTQLSN